MQIHSIANATPKKIGVNVSHKHDRFFSRCVELFDKEQACLVYEFYTKYMETIHGPKALGTLQDKRIAHLNESIRKVSSERFLIIIMELKNKLEIDPLQTRKSWPVNYVNRVIDDNGSMLFNKPSFDNSGKTTATGNTNKTKFTRYNNSSKRASEPVQSARKKVKPQKYERVTTNETDEYLNWTYKCECGQIYSAVTIVCPSCGGQVDLEEHY